MNHIVKSCSLTKLADSGFLQRHSADENSVTWLRDVMKVRMEILLLLSVPKVVDSGLHLLIIFDSVTEILC